MKVWAGEIDPEAPFYRSVREIPDGRGFGLIDDTDPAAWRPRPAFHTLHALLEKLDGAVFARKLETPGGEFALEFSRPGAAPLTVCWTLSSAPEYA